MYHPSYICSSVGQRGIGRKCYIFTHSNTSYCIKRFYLPCSKALHIACIHAFFIKVIIINFRFDKGYSIILCKQVNLNETRLHSHRISNCPEYYNNQGGSCNNHDDNWHNEPIECVFSPSAVALVVREDVQTISFTGANGCYWNNWHHKANSNHHEMDVLEVSRCVVGMVV